MIPAFNSAPYLRSTLDACALALGRTGWSAEVIVVDDGSTDGTGDLIEQWAGDFPVELRVVRQSNKGRFLARWTGLEVATGGNVLLLDSRVILGPDVLRHIERSLTANPARQVWNGHAITDPDAPLVGHFWEVPVHVFWGDFLGNPRPIEFGVDNFNRYPKGTGVFFAPRQVLMDACRDAWPEGDAALASDDTKVIRGIAARHPIQLDPEFWATYRPRTNVRDFVRHSFGRGTFLVDSFGGTSAGWSIALLVLAVLPLALLAALVAVAVAAGWWAFGAVVAACLLAACLPAAVAAVRGCPARGVLAYLVFLPVFVLPYWAGLVRGLVVHGARVFGRAPVPVASARGAEN
ncbi:glycosyltransferase family 2 protein [Pengzhenrongella frigida]|uniref:glycosyltransferase family 2 protein n=1 Tax=Pengzhenrongella frigida TaxID=1259133 RepID=UPI0013E9DAD8|nr:glycosyltransferase family A protein [Cellulomonas sp. HLT2-17]